MRRVVVGFSGGVTSAWCAGWALRTYPRADVVLLWHDTREEDPDTYRFLRQMAGALGMPITERSDGRSVTEVFRDEGFLGNQRAALCSRILKAEQGDLYFRELRAEGVTEIVKVLGYSAHEWERVQRASARGGADGYEVRFPMIETGTTKQQASDWCACTMGVPPSAMYKWAEHANCVGCVRGGRGYWLAVAEHAPSVFEQRASLEEEFGHTILRGEKRKSEDHPPTLRELVKIGLHRRVGRKEAIEIGPCDCGD